jgi:hypothetical protein
MLISSQARRSQDRRRDGSSGAASPCRRIDPQTGLVLGIGIRVSSPAAQLRLKPGWRSHHAMRRSAYA